MQSSSPPGSPQRRALYQNTVSLLGMVVVLFGAAIILLLLLAQIFDATPQPYVGMFIFLIVPAAMVFGIAMVLGGMRWEASRRRRVAALAELPYPRVDLNEPRQRRLFVAVVLVGTLVATLLVWAGFGGYQFTESVTFCGQTCHVPMAPEYTAYLDSAHARVRCVECHVGEGVVHYARSKFQGAHQLLALIANNYARPIATPIKNLRPARDTCEKCHWPEKFFGAKLLQLPHFRYDEANTPEQVTLVLKTGGGNKVHGESGGVHWHMMIENRVTFAATDRQLQDIPWTRVQRADGSETTYVSTTTKLGAEQLAQLPPHKMDCMDCHNRPAHGFPSPDGGIDQALFKRQISPTLPSVKKILVEAMMVDYADRESAHRGFRERLIGAYRKSYPKILEERLGDVEQAIAVASQIFDRAVFPEMRVTWQTYPTNIGHRSWPGCFRCHDGRHVSPEGRVLGNDCAGTCHTQPQRSPPTTLGVVHPDATPDWHPWQMPSTGIDIPAHRSLICSNCHQAGRGPISGCDDCHKK